MNIGNVKTTRFEKFMAVLLSISMLLSSVTGISLVNTAKAASANASEPEGAMHFMFRHWHAETMKNDENTETLDKEHLIPVGLPGAGAVAIEGYILPPERAGGDYTFVQFTIGGSAIDVTKTDAYKVGPYDVEPSDEGVVNVKLDDKTVVSVDVKGGTVSVYANPGYDEKQNKDLEEFAGFSISTGYTALDAFGDEDEPYITATFSDNVSLVKSHIFYRDVSTLVDGTPFDNGAGAQLETDTAYVYTVDGEIFDEDDANSQLDPLIVDEANLVYDDETGAAMLIEEPDYPDAIKEIIEEKEEQDEEVEIGIAKIYNSAKGLHTDKTAKVAEFSDRQYKVELEAWFTGADVASTGLILDASGSMAWPSDDVTGNIIMGDEYYEAIYNEYISKTNYSAAKTAGVIIYDASSTPATEVEWEKGTDFNSAAEFAAYMQDNKIITLNQDLVDIILDKTKTANYKLGYGNYRYMIFDPRSGNGEPMQIGYWDGFNASSTAVGVEVGLPQYNKLVGYYGIAQRGVTARGTAGASGDSDYYYRDWMTNSAKPYTPSTNNTSNLSGSYAMFVPTQQSIGSINFSKSTFVSYQDWLTTYGTYTGTSSGPWSNVGYKFADGTGLSLGESTRGIWLESSEDITDALTISFAMSSTDNAGRADGILYVGDSTGTNYFRLWKGNNSGTLNQQDGDGAATTISNAYGALKYYTYVFEKKDDVTTVTVYQNGKQQGDTTTLTNDIFGGDVNIIFNGITPAANAASNILIDEIYVYNTALNTDEVGELYACQSASTKNLTQAKLEALKGQIGGGTSPNGTEFLQNEDGTIIGGLGSGIGSALNNGKSAGWYYVSHTSNFAANYEDAVVGTGKTYIPLYKLLTFNDADGNDVDYLHYSYYGDEDKAVPDYQTQQSASGKTAVFTYDVDNYTPIKFFINEAGKLCCFYNSGSGGRGSEIKDSNGKSYSPKRYPIADDRYGWSYVYEKKDSDRTKSEALQYALGLFATELSEQSPDSEIGAVRFSLATGGNALPANYLDKLVLLDWTSDSRESAELMNLQRGDGTTLGFDLSDGGVAQYNYGLTGGTNTAVGLKAFLENLAETANPDSKKYVILFTDGKDTQLTDFFDPSKSTYLGEGTTVSEAIKRTEAFTEAGKLRDEGYTIFPVLLSAGSVKRGSADFEQAYQFLYALRTGETLDNMEDRYLHIGDISEEDIEECGSIEAFLEQNGWQADGTDESNRIKDADGYPLLVSKYGDNGALVYVGDTTEELVQIFTGDILEQILTHLRDYTVQDYLDPRFDLIDIDGEKWELNENGIVVAPDGEGGTVTIYSVANGKHPSDIHPDMYNEGDEPTIFYVDTVTLCDGSGANKGAFDADLYYDKSNDLYLLRWENQTIPSSAENAKKLPIWHSTITLEAKEDFLGGNTVLTNGNDEGMNYVYYNGDDEKDSGTDRMGTEYDKDNNKYPSKGFPRTTVNVRVPVLEIIGGEQIIYMGETITESGVAQQLGEIIGDSLEETPDNTGHEDYFNPASWYWEYLMRYVRLGRYEDMTNDQLQAALTSLLQDIANAKFNESALKNANGWNINANGTFINNRDQYIIPYYYIYSQSRGNSVGDAKTHQKDLLGYLYFKWTPDSIDKDLLDENGSIATVDTRMRTHMLTVEYVPLTIKERLDIIESEDSLIIDENFKSVKYPVGYSQPDYTNDGDDSNDPTDAEDPYFGKCGSLSGTGMFETRIVKGEIALELRLDYDMLKKLYDYGFKGKITYVADIVPVEEGTTTDQPAGIAEEESNEESNAVGTLTVEFDLSKFANPDSITKTTVDGKDYIIVYADVEYVDGFDNDTGANGLPIGAYTLVQAEGTEIPTSLKYKVVTSRDIDEEDNNNDRFDTWKSGWRGNDDQKGEVTGGNFLNYAAKVEDGADGANATAYLGGEETANSGRKYTDNRLAMFLLEVEPQTGDLEISKTVVDEISGNPDDDEFSFTAEFTTPDDNALNGTFTYTKTDSEGEVIEEDVEFDIEDGKYDFTLRDGETITFKDLPAGVTYTVTETDLDGTGYTSNIDDEEAASTDGTIEADEIQSAEFVNIYSADGSIEIGVQKTVAGRDWLDGETFTFEIELTEVPTDAPDDAVINPETEEAMSVGDKVQIVVDSEDAQLFGEFVFNAIGEYKFNVYEVDPERDDVVYDDTVYEVTVTVTDNRDGTLTAAAAYVVEGTTTGNGPEYLPFENKVTTTADIPISKVVEGRPWADGESFSFSISLKTGDKDNVKIPVNTIAITDADGTAYTKSFEDIEFYAAGTYVFEIIEKAPAEDTDYFTYDRNKYEVTVTVGIEGNEFKVTSISTDSKPVVFTNSYETEGELTVTVNKDIDGRDWITDDSYSFTVAAADDATAAAIGTYVTLPADLTVDGATHSTSGKIIFKSNGQAETTYKFTITEDDIDTDKLSGISKDTTSYELTVKVTDDFEGNLTVEVTDGSNSVTFTNTYTVEDNAELDIGIDKTLTGRDWITGDSFEFTLTLTGIVAAKAPTTVKAGDTWTAVIDDGVDEDTAYPGAFDKITLDAEGKYTFTLIEEAIDENGLKSDPVTYTIVVTVKDDKHGSLAVDSIEITSDKNPGGTFSKDAIPFTNTYEAAPAVLDTAITITKVLEGRPWENTDEFNFIIEAVKDYGDAATITNNTITVFGKDTADGENSQTVSFGTFTFTEVGEYEFTVREIKPKPAAAGMKYDEVPRTFTVKVSDPNYDGQLVAEIDGDSAFEFTNTYKEPLPGTTEIEIEKTQAVGDGTPTDKKLTVEAGDTVTYYLTVTNIGDVTAEGVVVTDEIPAGLTLGTINNDGKLLDDGKTIVWYIGDVEDTVTVSFTVTVPEVEEDTEWTNTAIVSFDNNADNPEKDPDSSDEPDPNDPHKDKTTQDSNDVVIEEEVEVVEPSTTEIEIEKTQAVNDGTPTDKKLTVEAGDIVTYYLTVTNIGDVIAEGVVVTDEIPAGLTLGTINNDGKLLDDGKTIVWYIGDVDDTVTVSFTVTVPEVEEDTEWTNTAIVSYDNNADNPEKDPDSSDEPDPNDPHKDKTTQDSNDVVIEEEVEVVEPSTTEIEIEKTQAVNDGTPTDKKLTVEAGDIVTYYLTVTNIGDVTAEGVVVTDEIPAGLTLGTINNDGKLLDDGKTIVWYIGDVEDTVTVSFTVTVPEVEEDTEWTNTAIASFDNNADNPEKDPDSSDEPDPNDPHKDKTTQDSNEVVIEEEGTPEPPATEPPATEPPATEPPATEPPATEPPATEPPATEPPATEPPATTPPTVEEGDGQDNEQDNPSTGVALNVGALMTGSAFLAVGVFFTRKRKSGKNGKNSKQGK
ncbi:MAG: DUF11 domain-containing protein [Eubacterium sp.]|nr:DUF11 domain-containing protein [Eubacterium sp.]